MDKKGAGLSLEEIVLSVALAVIIALLLAFNVWLYIHIPQ